MLCNNAGITSAQLMTVDLCLSTSSSKILSKSRLPSDMPLSSAAPAVAAASGLPLPGKYSSSSDKRLAVLDNRMGDSGWSSRGGAGSHFPICYTSKVLTFFHSSVCDIILPTICIHLRHGAGDRQVIALLAHMVLPVTLTLAVQFMSVCSLQLHVIDHHCWGAGCLHHHTISIAAHHHTHP